MPSKPSQSNQGKPWQEKLYLWSLRHRRVGAFLLSHLEVGECTTYSGKKYWGFKVSGKW